MGMFGQASSWIGGSLSGSDNAKKQIKRAQAAQNAAIADAEKQLQADFNSYYKEALKGYDDAADVYKSEWDTIKDLYDEEIDLGDRAVERLDKLTTPGSEYYAEDPGYLWRLAQGQAAIENANVARGMGMSGNTLVDLNKYTQGEASNEFGSTFDRYLALANLGGRASDSKVGATTWYAGTMGNNRLARGATSSDLLKGKSYSLQDYDLMRGGVNANRYSQMANLELANAPITLAATALGAFMGGGYAGQSRVAPQTTQTNPGAQMAAGNYSGNFSNGAAYSDEALAGQGTSLASLYGW